MSTQTSPLPETGFNRLEVLRSYLRMVARDLKREALRTNSESLVIAADGLERVDFYIEEHERITSNAQEES